MNNKTCKRLDSTQRTLRGIVNIMLSVICPAYTFRSAYKEFEPDSFLWWCKVCAGLLMLVMFAVSLQAAFEKGTCSETESQKRRQGNGRQV